MSSPKPLLPLDDPCSVIIDNTLYVYSPAGFQSLSLNQNATWTSLPNGISVQGARCVPGLDNGPGSGDALWVVGGVANQTSPDYPGLQKYSFTQKAWSSIEPVVKVTQNRRNHGAAFLNATGQILVYAGSQDDPDTPSIETFVIDTIEPYNVLSYSSHNAPVIAPVLLPWDGSSAIAIGGTQNTNIYRFAFNTTTRQASWQEYPTQLPASLKGPSTVQAVLVQGTDNSKVLQAFDMGSIPCEATTLVLQDANGQPGQTGQTVGFGISGKMKRDLTIANWPSYNSTSAPDYTRDGYSVAQGSNGLVAMTGGNPDHPISLFDDSSNAWVDTTQFFGPQHDVNTQSVLGPSSKTSSAPTPPATSATSSPTDLPTVPNGHRTSVILGAVLGSILGLIAILIIILLIFYFRRKKKQQEAYAAAEEKERRMSFADRGAPLMMEGGGMHVEKNPHSSVAMLGNSNANHGRPSTRGSDSSTTRLIPRKAPPGGHETHEMSPIGETSSPHSHVEGSRGLPLATPSSNADSGYHTTHQRNSGWSRYFGNGTAAAGGAAVGAAGVTGYRQAAGRTSADTHSTYTNASSHDCTTHGPTELPPLKFGDDFERERVSKVVTGSPPTSPPTTGYGNRSSDSRTRTLNSEISTSSIDEALFARPPTEETTNWSPVIRNDWSAMNTMGAKPRDRDTTSSIYSHTPRNSEGYGKPLQPIIEDSVRKPQAARVSNATTALSSRTSGGPDIDAWPRPPSAGKGLTVRTNSTKTVDSSRTADSPPPLPKSFNRDLEPPDEFAEEGLPATPTAVTAIPVPASTAMQYTVRKPSPKPASNTDMSWINLGPIQNRNG